MPGFIDLHVHGAIGQEVMDTSPSGLEEIARFYASHGVTSFLATTWTADRRSIMNALELVQEMKGSIQGGSTLLGVHLEGPYLNPTRCRAGCELNPQSRERGSAGVARQRRDSSACFSA